MDRDKVDVHENAAKKTTKKKKRGLFPAILSKQAWSIMAICDSIADNAQK